MKFLLFLTPFAFLLACSGEEYDSQNLSHSCPEGQDYNDTCYSCLPSDIASDCHCDGPTILCDTDE